jgi:lipid A disaccharide synthetase
VALPNVLAGRLLVPEHLQDLDPAQITADLFAWLGRKGQVPREIVASLQPHAAIERAADEVQRWLRAAAR